MSLPAHILAAPTPKTDAVHRRLIYSPAVTCANTLDDHARTIERQLVYAMEVMEKLVKINSLHSAMEALAAYEQFKKDVEQV